MKTKKYIALLLLLGFGLLYPSQETTAQGLEFSRVLRVGSVQDTVPAGKVWKVESYWQSRTTFDLTSETTCGNASRHHPFYIDNAYFYKYDGGANTGSTNTRTAVGNTFPLWLPAGTRLRTVCPEDFLSVIEFSE